MKKLLLNKETVAILNTKELYEIKGLSGDTCLAVTCPATCPVSCQICPTTEDSCIC